MHGNVSVTYLLVLVLNGIVSQHTVTSYGSDGYTAFYVESGVSVICPGAQVSLTGTGATFIAKVCSDIVFESNFERATP